MSENVSQKTATTASAPLPSSSKREQSSLFRWLGGHLAIIVRLALACVLTICMALPLASMFITKLGSAAFDNLISGVPLSETRIIANPISTTDKSMPSESGVQGQSTTFGNGEREEKEATSAAPRVTAYTVQIAGLLAALAGTLWAVVALSRVE